MSCRQRTLVPGMCSWPLCTRVTCWAALWLCADPRPWVYLFIYFMWEDGFGFFPQPSAPLPPIWHLKLLTSCRARAHSDKGNRRVMAGVFLLHLISSLSPIEFADSTSIFSPGETEAQSS